MKKRMICMLLAIVLVVGLMPGMTLTAFAADDAADPVSARSINLGYSNIANGDVQNQRWDHLYLGTYNNSPLKWRVLSNAGVGDSYKDAAGSAYTGGAPFLMTEYLLEEMTFGASNVWAGSDVQTWCNGTFTNSAFSETEKDSVLLTSKCEAEAYMFQSWDKKSIYAAATTLTDEAVFFPSAEEIRDHVLGSVTAGRPAYSAEDQTVKIEYWTRTALRDFNKVFFVNKLGNLAQDVGQPTSIHAARPAFHLNASSVLLTSAAVGGKPDGFHAVQDYSGNEYKLTLNDSSRDEFTARVKENWGNRIDVSYFKAKNGANEYVSAVIADENNKVSYYGRLAQVTSVYGGGTVTITLPDSFDPNTDTLYVFNEQHNGDYMTDYASAFVEIPTTSPAVVWGASAEELPHSGSLAEAFAAAAADTSVKYIQLTQSATMAGTHTIPGGAFTLDLNGKTITQPSGTAISITGGTVTITDTGTGGAIEATADAVFVEGGDLLITGDPVIYGKGTGVTVRDGTVKIEGGDITGYGTAAVYALWTGQVTISGGQMHSNYHGLYVVSGGQATVTGGTITSNYHGAYAAWDYSGTNSRLTVTGGEISGVYECVYVGRNTDVTITGGSLKRGTDAHVFIYEGGALTLDVGEDGNGPVFPNGVSISGRPLSGILAEGAAYWTDGARADVADGKTSISDVEVRVRGEYSIQGSEPQNGSVTLEKQYASAGDQISFAVVPDEWYEVEAVTVQSGEGVDLSFTDNGDGTYTFTQPENDVSINVTFRPDTFAVTLVTNGGTIHAGTVTSYTYGVGATLPTNVTKTGRRFGGWYDNADCVGTAVTEITAEDSGDKTFYAKWDSLDIPSIPSDTAYPPVVNGGDNGDVRVIPKNPKKGDTVIIAPDPDGGYEVDEITVTDKNGNPVTVVDNGDGTYSFKQPGGKVSIEVTFTEAIKVCPMYGYTDLDMTAWYHDGIHYCIERGLMNGVGSSRFNPNGTTTRAMIVTILWRLEGSPIGNYTMDFGDVVAGQWYTEAIRWAAGEKLVEGYGNGKFGTSDAITREQLVTLLFRYAQYKGYDVSVGENTNILSYDDAFDVADWAIPAMQWACGSGIIQGIADGNQMNLAPQGNAIRAQAAAILQRFCENAAANA